MKDMEQCRLHVIRGMKAPAKTKKDLVHHFDSEDFVSKTIAQINKDLGGVSEVFVESKTDTGEKALAQLIAQLKDVLEGFDNYEKLMQFIYRVDLNESDFHVALEKGEWEVLAFLIIRREAQKVYLRQKFSDHS